MFGNPTKIAGRYSKFRVSRTGSRALVQAKYGGNAAAADQESGREKSRVDRTPGARLRCDRPDLSLSLRQGFRLLNRLKGSLHSAFLSSIRVSRISAICSVMNFELNPASRMKRRNSLSERKFRVLEHSGTSRLTKFSALNSRLSSS
jgi:hypothetical protein